MIAGAVSEVESLFSYSLAASTSYASFQYPDHQPVFLDQLTLTIEQMEQCGSNKQCAYDYAQTGDVEIGLSTMNIEQSNSMGQILLGMLVRSPESQHVLKSALRLFCFSQLPSQHNW